MAVFSKSHFFHRFDHDGNDLLGLAFGQTPQFRKTPLLILGFVLTSDLKLFLPAVVGENSNGDTGSVKFLGFFE